MNILSFYRNKLLSCAVRLSLITHHPSRVTASSRTLFFSRITHHALLITVFIVLCSLTAPASAAETSSEPGTALEKVIISKQLKAAHNLSGRQTDATFFVEVIKEIEGRKKGLSGRESLPKDHAMLFVLDASPGNAFWMKGMNFPLDIIFIGQDMRIIEILEDLQPCKQCPVYFPKGRPAYALEINAGLARKRGIAIGDILVIDKQ